MAKLSVIMGGGDASRPCKFINGHVTDTRLMGVLGMHLHWVVPEVPESDIHQFFYYDFEELGLDTLTIYRGNEEAAVELTEKASFGGLGGKPVPISEREARGLVCFFKDETIKKGENLPEQISELDFITEHPVYLSGEEKRALGLRLCVKRKGSFAPVHYFLMRLFGRDPEGAELLTDGTRKAEVEKAYEEIGVKGGATFLMNSISDGEKKDGAREYLCESLVEADEGHSMVFTTVTVENGLVTGAKLQSKFRITPIEASLKLRREEYVSVYEIPESSMNFEMNFSAFSLGTTATPHENGVMYMKFKANNSHVEKRVFNLSDDIEALYYVTDYGQFIAAAYSPAAIGLAEAKIARSPLRGDIFPTEKYRFADSVLYEFAQSDFDDFVEFVETMTK